MFLIGKTDLIPIATYTLVCCGLTVLTLFITLVYKYKRIATHISTFTEHDAEKSVTIDPMHTHCTWYEFYQIRIKRNKWDDLRICCQPCSVNVEICVAILTFCNLYTTEIYVYYDIRKKLHT
jgi:dTDP-4-dehydrorhamnose reductase